MKKITSIVLTVLFISVFGLPVRAITVPDKPTSKKTTTVKKAAAAAKTKPTAATKAAAL